MLAAGLAVQALETRLGTAVRTFTGPSVNASRTTEHRAWTRGTRLCQSCFENPAKFPHNTRARARPSNPTGKAVGEERERERQRRRQRQRQRDRETERQSGGGDGGGHGYPVSGQSWAQIDVVDDVAREDVIEADALALDGPLTRPGQHDAAVAWQSQPRTKTGSAEGNARHARRSATALRHTWHGEGTPPFCLHMLPPDWPGRRWGGQGGGARAVAIDVHGKMYLQVLCAQHPTAEAPPPPQHHQQTQTPVSQSVPL